MSERGLLFEEIIETLAKESGKHIDIIINELARHYEIEEREITKELKAINSKFIDDTNRIVGYIDGEPIKRTTYHMSCIRIFRKIVSGYKRVSTFDPNDQSHIGFITEAVYSHLKSDGNPIEEV